MSDFTFDHIALSVNDVDRSIQFYITVFDLREIENTASDSKTRWLALGEDKQLHLIPRPNAEIKVNKALHFALSIVDMNKFLDHLKDLNIEYSDWPNTPKKDYIRKDGIRQVYFRDPDGYWLEVNDANNKP